MGTKNQNHQELPYEGEFFYAPQKKFKETIFFVHFYEGSKRKLLRHIRMVNQLGYDAFAFNLQGDFQSLQRFKLPFTQNKKYGLKHSYAEQINTLLNLIPGDKIIYSFSNPSAAAIEAVKMRNFKDIKAIVCDSGPSAYFFRSGISLYMTELRDRVTPLMVLLTPFIALSWSPFFHYDIKWDLSKYPAGFNILTIEGEKDPLIPPYQIEEVFKDQKHLAWQRTILPEAGHLDGLKRFPEDYQKDLVPFLTKNSTPLTDETSKNEYSKKH